MYSFVYIVCGASRKCQYMSVLENSLSGALRMDICLGRYGAWPFFGGRKSLGSKINDTKLFSKILLIKRTYFVPQESFTNTKVLLY